MIRRRLLNERMVGCREWFRNLEVQAYPWRRVAFIKSYIKHFGSDNVKRKTALQIGWNNWQNKIPLELPKKLLKSDYRSFHEFKRAKEFSKKESPKFRFIHDLMIDFAIYLRKWAALLDPEFPSKYFRFSGGYC